MSMDNKIIDDPIINIYSLCLFLIPWHLKQTNILDFDEQSHSSNINIHIQQCTMYLSQTVNNIYLSQTCTTYHLREYILLPSSAKPKLNQIGLNLALFSRYTATHPPPTHPQEQQITMMEQLLSNWISTIQPILTEGGVSFPPPPLM